MKSLKRIPLLAALLTVIAPAGFAADSPGQITGVVSNKNTKTVLQEARVDIPSLGKSALTDEVGRYTILDVPPGAHQLRVSYLGLDDQTVPVQVAAGEKATKDIALTSEVYLLESFVVTGEREGQAAAITRQRNADNIKNVLAMDAFGLLPNDNVGELLIQVPGIVGDLDDEGNITGVSVRGMGSYTTSFTMDGNSLSGTGDERTFNTRDISAALFDEIEIIKAPTPENEGNSLGGSVNLKTLSTLRTRNRVLTYRVSGVWAPSFADQIPLVTKNQALSAKLNLSYKDIFSVFGGRNNLGMSLNLIYDETFKGYYSNTYQYEYTEASPAFIWNYSATDTYSKRINQSASLRFDLKVSPSTTVYATVTFNDALQPDNESYTANLRGAVNGYDAGMTNQPGYLDPPQVVRFGNILPGYTDDFTAVRLVSGNQVPEGLDRVRYPRAIATSNLTSSISRGRAFSIGAVHEFSRLLLDYDVNYNYNHTNMSDGHNRNGMGGQFRLQATGRHTWSIDKSKSWERPSVISTNPVYPLDDLLGYGATAGEFTKNDGRKRENSFFNANANARYILPFAIASSIKTGVRYRTQELANKNGERSYAMNGDDPDVASGAVLQSFHNPSVDISSQYTDNGFRMPFFDVAAVARDFITHPEHWRVNPLDDEANDHRRSNNVTEDVTAAYIQGTAKIGAFSLLAGVRVERTETESFAYLQTVNSTGSANWNEVTPRTVNTSYDNWFPSAHLKYDITANLLLRASWSNTIGRPRFADLIPNYTYDAISNEGRVYNPNLKPQTSMNWDLSLEYYLKQVGQFSVGYFRKDIDDFLARARVDPPEWVVDDPSVQSDAVFLMPFNGRSAVINGYEISYQQNLTFLPGVLSGLSVYANYTHLDMSGDYGNEGNSTDALERFVPNTANLTLTWKVGRLTVSTSANYTDDQLYTYGVNKWDLIYKEGRTNFNARLNYSLARGVTLSCDVINITEEPQRYYYFTKTRPRQYSNAGMTVIFGLSGRF